MGLARSWFYRLCWTAGTATGIPLSGVAVALGAPSATPPPACPVGERGAFTELGCEIGAAFKNLGPGVAVAVGPVKSDRPVTQAVALSARLGRSVVATLSGAVQIPGSSTLDQARAVTKDTNFLVFVVPEIADGEFRVAADIYPVARGFWDRLRSPNPDAVEHAFARRRLDGEVASFLRKVPLVSTRTDRAALSSTDVVALACGAPSPEAGLELVVVGRHKIQLGHIRNGAFTLAAETTWASLSPIAPSPLREPIAAVDVVPGKNIDIGSTDRAVGFRLSTALTPITRLDGEVPFPRVGCLVRTGIALGSPGPCARGDALGMNVGNVGVIDAFASGTTVDGAGRARAVIAFRSAGDHAVVLRDDAGHTSRVTGAGAALALGDVDLDGEPDLITSLDTLNPADDALVVSSWGADGAVHERLRIAVPDGIRAIAACPPEDAQLSPIVVATGTGLWILR